MSATSRYYRPPTETRRIPTYEELFGTPKSAERIAYDKQKEQEARISAEEARKRRIEEDKKEREAYLAEQERIKSERLIAEGKEIVGTYRDSYDANAFLYETAENPYQRQQRLGLSDLELGLEIVDAAVQNPSDLGISNKEYLNRYDINLDGKVTSRDSKKVMEGNLADLFPLETVENPYERQQRLGLSDLELGVEIADAAVMRSSGLGLTEEEYLNRYDINLDGKVTSKDAKRVMEGDFADLFPAPETQATFEDAKLAADETYMQYWYDKANNIVGNWTDEDYKLIAEPQYEDVQVAVDSKRGVYRTEQRRVLPEGYEELQEINSYIEKGPLDFSSEETHKMLINPAGRRGYGKYQTWINESNPLRQAVEAQADVMKDYLDKEGIPIVTKYEDVEGFERPDPFRGEGFYLNTGTAAHIDWDSELKRMQRYESAPNAELGTYSQVFVRPDPDYGALGDVLSVVGTLTGNPVMRNLGIAAQGGDVEDIIKGAVLQQVVPNDFLEDTLASVNITNDTINDLVGSDIGSTAWSEGLANVTTTGLEGGSIGDAFLGEFGGDLATPVVGGALDAIPDIDIPEAVTNVIETVETVAQPVINAVQTATETVGNVVDTAIIDPIDKLTEALIPDDVSLDDVVPSVEAVAEIEETPVEPEETPVEPEETPVEPEETVAETQEEIPVEPEETTLVGKVAAKIGLDDETLADLTGSSTDEVNKVFKETDDALFAGESGKDALLEGLGGSALEELEEGAENLLSGAVDFVETILPLDPLENVVGAGVELADAVIGVVGDSELVNAIEEGGKALGNLGQSAIDAVTDNAIVQAVGDVGQQAINIGSDILSEAEDIVRETGSAIDKNITQPALTAIGEGVDAISKCYV